MSFVLSCLTLQGIVEWHQTAENILLSAGFDYLIIVWNIVTGKPLKEISCHTDTIYRYWPRVVGGGVISRSLMSVLLCSIIRVGFLGGLVFPLEFHVA